jgi:uncharacterized damage-inducible protein DinB
MDLLDRLLGHDHWTTARLLDLSRGLTDAQLDQDFDIGQRTLRDTFDHMIFNVAAWTAEMAGDPIDREREDRSVAALRARHDRAYSAFADLARWLRDEARLDETYVDDYGQPQTFGGTIAHVILHDAQHRGEALHILQRLGVEALPEGDPLEWEHETQAS